MSVVSIEHNRVIQPDITVYKDNKPQLLLEVKFRKSVTEYWAAKYRSNLLTHFEVSETPYFMLVLPDKTFLWDPEVSITEHLPEHTFSTPELFSRYIDSDEELQNLHETSLELMSRFWLDRFNLKRSENEAQEHSEDTLPSALYEALHGSTVAFS